MYQAVPTTILFRGFFAVKYLSNVMGKLWKYCQRLEVSVPTRHVVPSKFFSDFLHNIGQCILTSNWILLGFCAQTFWQNGGKNLKNLSTTEWCEHGADTLQNTKEVNHVIVAEHSSYNIGAQKLSSLKKWQFSVKNTPQKSLVLLSWPGLTILIHNNFSLSQIGTLSH